MMLVLLLLVLPWRLGDHLVERQPHAAPRHGRGRGCRGRRRLLLLLLVVVVLMVRERERLRWLLVRVWRRRRLLVRELRHGGWRLRLRVRVLRHGGWRRLRVRVGRHGGSGLRLRLRLGLSLRDRGRHGLRRSAGGGERRDVLGLHLAQI